MLERKVRGEQENRPMCRVPGCPQHQAGRGRDRERIVGYVERVGPDAEDRLLSRVADPYLAGKNPPQGMA
jgi:hypothetical protein